LTLTDTVPEPTEPLADGLAETSTVAEPETILYRVPLETKDCVVAPGNGLFEVVVGTVLKPR
jgi:hypothetical protein